MLELFQFKKLKASHWLMLLGLNLAALETISYFYGISNLSIVTDSFNPITILTLFIKKMPIPSIGIFFTLLLISVATCILFLEPVKKDKAKKYFFNELLDNILLLLQVTIITYFITRFILKSKIDSPIELSEIIVPSIFITSLFLSFRHYFNKKFSINITFWKIIVWALWPISVIFIFKLYILNDAVYSITQISDSGYLKDFILMAIIGFLIAILPPILSILQNLEVKMFLSSGLFLILLLMSGILFFFDLRFPNTQQATEYIKEVLIYNKIDDLMFSRKFIRVMEFHVILRTGVFLIIMCVLPFSINLLYQAITAMKKINQLKRIK